jgi:hypothetical protein
MGVNNDHSSAWFGVSLTRKLRTKYKHVAEVWAELYFAFRLKMKCLL